MNTSDILQTLTSLAAVSGSEDCIYDILEELLSEYNCKRHLGGLTVTLDNKTSADKHILIDAHIDQIGFRVTSITDDGFLTVDKSGGIDKRILPAQKVLIHGKETIKGVFCSTPPHLSSDNANIPEINEMFIDVGMSKDKVCSIVSIGDTVTFDSPMRKLVGNRVSSSAFDNRAGCCALIKLLEILKDIEADAKITAVFSTQEEVGLRGAKMLGTSINPDYAICLDVSFAMAPGENPEKCGIMGNGPMIGISPTLDKTLSNLSVKIAQNENIPYQQEIMSSTTSTNADTYSVSGSGVKCALISIPIRYMHTPTEVCDLNDIDNTAILLSKLIESIASGIDI